jgi:hypothetical protein
MATSPYFSQKVKSEQSLYEDIVIEALKFYGQDVYYIPREIVNKDEIFVADIPSRFTDAYTIEMYIENIEGFDGEGDLFTKFGVEIRDQATFIVARRRWKQLIGNYLDENNFRPREGDIIYLPLSESMFQIMKVETETPFYQLSNLPTYRLRCELFEYSGEDFDTEIDAVDQIELEGAYQYRITTLLGEDAQAIAVTTDIRTEDGSITEVSIVDSGRSYNLNASPYTLQVTDLIDDISYFGNSAFNINFGRYEQGNYLRTNDNGLVEMFVRVTGFPDSGEYAGLFISGGQDSGADAVSRYAWGINSQGQLVRSAFDNTGRDIQTFDTVVFNTDSWNHLLIGNEDSNEYIYFKGEKVHDSDNPILPKAITTAGYEIGYDVAGLLDGIQWQTFRGYVDEFRAAVGTKSALLSERYDSSASVDSAIAIPTAAFDSDSATAILRHFDQRTATIKAYVDSDTLKIKNLVIQDGGFLLTAPQLVVPPPYTSTDSDFKIGDNVFQDFGTYRVWGEIAHWSDSDGVLRLVHVGATDGKLHSFTVDGEISDSAERNSRIILAVEEVQEVQPEAQNRIFDNFETDFLDFSESNPFGDMQ